MSRVSMHWGWIVVVTLAWVIVPRSAEGQFITRWVNANGVVTFSTSSPPPGVEYEPIHMPVRSRKAAADVGTPDAPSAADPKSSAEPAKTSGEAVLKVQDQATTSVSETQWLLAAKVKNDGGTAADGVGVRISVLEDGQGNPCLEDQGTVNPSTLQPGETGTFERTYDSPCFFGSPHVSIVVEWTK